MEMKNRFARIFLEHWQEIKVMAAKTAVEMARIFSVG
jgi:hypothetical protein